MYRLELNVQTQKGEIIGVVGSIPALGSWSVDRCVHLTTDPQHYPRWWTELDLTDISKIEYKYVRLFPNGRVEWEPGPENRWLPALSPSEKIVVQDGTFGEISAWPFGYWAERRVEPQVDHDQGLKIVLIGSSVAAGHNAWLMQGWAWQLEQALGEHRFIHRAIAGTNVSITIDKFPSLVTAEQPHVVLVALSLGNEGLATCAVHERRAVQRRFECGLLQLIRMIRALGAQPMLGGVYPNGNYTPEHYALLQETHQRMLSWGVPVFDWLGALDDGKGRWQAQLCSDPAHPNTLGHRRMFEAIDLSLFQLDPAQISREPEQVPEVAVYSDQLGFHIFAEPQEKKIRIINTTAHTYTIHPGWQALQSALQTKAQLSQGLYLAPTPDFFAVSPQGTIETTLAIHPGSNLEFSAALNYYSPHIAQILFYDGTFGILKHKQGSIQVINESDHEYNLHPMWKEVRGALKQNTPGFYLDQRDPKADFRTLMIGRQGLESRVKIPPKSCVTFDYQGPLSEIRRVAILPLGDRCAIRMLLYKMEYDGPAFPFDLTRSTNLADVSDMIATNFQNMWNPDLLNYVPEEGRIYHTEWQGLSFAHEIEPTDDPLQDMFPIYERMRTRYTSRAHRFLYAIQHCDHALFIRTGRVNRSNVEDLLDKLKQKCAGKPFWLLLIGKQSSAQFAGLPNVLHYDLEFNPDRMYDDPAYWLACTEQMRGILNTLGVTSNNLFWCPPNPVATR